MIYNIFLYNIFWWFHSFSFYLFVDDTLCMLDASNFELVESGPDSRGAAPSPATWQQPLKTVFGKKVSQWRNWPISVSKRTTLLGKIWQGCGMSMYVRILGCYSCAIFLILWLHLPSTGASKVGTFLIPWCQEGAPFITDFLWKAQLLRMVNRIGSMLDSFESLGWQWKIIRFPARFLKGSMSSWPMSLFLFSWAWWEDSNGTGRGGGTILSLYLY